MHDDYKENTCEKDPTIVFICKRCDATPIIITILKNSLMIQCECRYKNGKKIRIISFNEIIYFLNDKDMEFESINQNKPNSRIKEVDEIRNWLSNEGKKINKRLKILIDTIIDNYIKYENNALDTNIQKIYDYFIEFKNNNESSKKLFTYREIEDIINQEELKKIEYVRIFQSDFGNMNVFGKLFENLEILDLSQNNIKNINKLVECKFPSLNILILKDNLIDDEIIQTFDKFGINFPILKNLNLKGNNLTKFKFFEIIKKVKLTELDVSKNSFVLQDNDENEIYDSFSIKKMILSNGVFDNGSISIIKNFKIEKIENLDLSYNNLKNLSFMNNVEWPHLETLNLNYNDITKIEILNKFKNLKTILIINNLIYDYKELEKIHKTVKIYTWLITKNQNDDVNNDETNLLKLNNKNKTIIINRDSNDNND